MGHIGPEEWVFELEFDGAGRFGAEHGEEEKSSPDVFGYAGGKQFAVAPHELAGLLEPAGGFMEDGADGFDVVGCGGADGSWNGLFGIHGSSFTRWIGVMQYSCRSSKFQAYKLQRNSKSKPRVPIAGGGKGNIFDARFKKEANERERGVLQIWKLTNL